MGTKKLFSRIFCREKNIATDDGFYKYDDLRFQFGNYKPSFFSITVNTAFRFDNIIDLPIEVQPTFYHEYFHYLQNITTASGINSSWNSLDRIRQLIGYSQKQKSPVQLPLTGTFKEEIQIQNNALYAINSDAHLVGKSNPNSFEIKNITLELRPEFQKFKPEVNLRFLKLHLQNLNGEIAQYWFGAFSILESMTYIIQSKFFGDTNPPIYPYRISNKLVEYANSSLQGKDDMIFALCDVSLFSNTPGKSFWEILLFIDRAKIAPNNAEEIYELGFQFYREIRYDVWQGFLESKQNLLKIVSQLYGHEIFINDKVWLETIIEEGYEIRRSNPMFMLDLFRSKEAFSKSFQDIYGRVGTPDVINLSGERWVSVPASLKHIEQKINPIFLSVYYEWHQVLLNNKRNCGLEQICRVAVPAMPINGYCRDSPWMKKNEEPICPFAAIMHVFGLDYKK